MIAAEMRTREQFAPHLLWGTLIKPGRRIGQRGDATRAPAQGQDRRGRHDAVPRPSGIGSNAINPLISLAMNPTFNEDCLLSGCG
jgi:hypothetical protein